MAGSGMAATAGNLGVSSGGTGGVSGHVVVNTGDEGTIGNVVQHGVVGSVEVTTVANLAGVIQPQGGSGAQMATGAIGLVQQVILRPGGNDGGAVLAVVHGVAGDAVAGYLGRGHGGQQESAGDQTTNQ